MAPVIESFLAEREWFSVLGLAIDIFAVVMLAWDFLIMKRLPSRPGDRPARPPPQGGEADPPAPTTWQRLRQEKITVLCLFLLAFGFALQMYGSWPR